MHDFIFTITRDANQYLGSRIFCDPVRNLRRWKLGVGWGEEFFYCQILINFGWHFVCKFHGACYSNAEACKFFGINQHKILDEFEKLDMPREL